MEKKQETKKTKSLTQKAKKIRSIIMMTLLCVLMMSAATYAWFTLSNTAKVSNMTMTVGDATGLQVADFTSGDTNGPQNENMWGSATSEATFKGKLLPAYSENGKDIYEPVYSDTDGSVTSIAGTNTSKCLTASSVESDEGYYVEHVFWIRAQGADGGKTDVQLTKGEGFSDGIYSESAKGTYSLSKEVTNANILPSAAVRISLINGDSATIFEPNSNYNTAATAIAKDNTGKTASSGTVTQDTSGTITPEDNVVFTIDNNTPTKITVRLWLEGTDPQCGNEISSKDIVSQLAFSGIPHTDTQ